MISGDDNELFAAVRSGDANLAADLLNKGAKVNAKGSNGNTPLHLAAIADELQVVEKLIEGGARTITVLLLCTGLLLTSTAV